MWFQWCFSVVGLVSVQYHNSELGLKFEDNTCNQHVFKHWFEMIGGINHCEHSEQIKFVITFTIKQKAVCFANLTWFV